MGRQNTGGGVLAFLRGVAVGVAWTLEVAPLAAAPAPTDRAPAGVHYFRTPGANRQVVPVPNGAQLVCPQPGTPRGYPCVVQTNPVVYVDFWGLKSRGRDPAGVEAYVKTYVQNVAGTTWLAILSQYGVTLPAQLCPQQMGLPVCFWDSTDAIKAKPTFADIQAEAYAAAEHFEFPGCPTPSDPSGNCSNINANVIVVTAKGVDPDNFETNGFCAYHYFKDSSPAGSPGTAGIAYTLMPYLPAFTRKIATNFLETQCGTNSVNPATPANGLLDGFGITLGHEIAEAITDPVILQAPPPATGYLELGYAWAAASVTNLTEIGDMCAWTGFQNIFEAGGVSFAAQLLYSNKAPAPPGAPNPYLPGACVIE